MADTKHSAASTMKTIFLFLAAVDYTRIKIPICNILLATAPCWQRTLEKDKKKETSNHSVLKTLLLAHCGHGTMVVRGSKPTRIDFLFGS